jgi:uncharacterized protein
MRRTDKEIKDSQIIEEIIQTAEFCRLALMDEHEPYIVPVNYGYKDNLIYIHSAPSGRKMEILKTNNKVCFEITSHSEVTKTSKACGWSTKYRSVIGYGTVEIITDDGLKRKGLDIIMARYGGPQENEYDDGNISRMVILKVQIERISGKQAGKWD